MVKRTQTKTCPACQSKIALKAIKCPHCQEDLRSWFRRHPILTFLGLIFLTPVILIWIMAFAVGLSGTDTEESKPDNSTSATQSTPSSTPVSTEYETCTLNADVKYSTTQLEVTNFGNFDWTDVVIKINSGLLSGGYQYKTVIEAGTTYTIGLMQFADSKGNRFNPYELKIQNIFITDRNTLCDYYAEVN